MRALTKSAVFVLSLLTGLQIQSDAAVVATLGAPTSTHNTLDNIPTWDGNGDTQDATFTSFIDYSANTNPLGAQLIWETGDAAGGASLGFADLCDAGGGPAGGGGEGGGGDVLRLAQFHDDQ